MDLSETSGGVDGLLLGDAVGVAVHAFYEVDGRDKKLMAEEENGGGSGICCSGLRGDDFWVGRGQNSKGVWGLWFCGGSCSSTANL
jgi:hypothetical protein